MRVMVVDDEAPARGRLLRLLATLEMVSASTEAADGQQALQRMVEHPVEVVLLDIRMPGMDGMAVARALQALPQPPVVIFTTAYGEHALEAFEAQAMDYLLKPVRLERLQQALERAASLFSSREPSPQLSVRRHGELHLLPLDEVLYFQADHKYVTAYRSGREDLLEESLKQLEEAWPERLLRVHRNALVAIRALAGLEKQADGSWRVVLKGIAHGPEVSRRHLPGLRRILRGAE
ncbi:MAG: LytTR family DNA-binding domain-containing protein [Chromatiales bacterium]|nr:response regulator transcription factor [Gammaproteobacteria bacterium]MBW6476064.1 LytTR family DNA-binding domain-containing protein [Chromatiales bacterium]